MGKKVNKIQAFIERNERTVNVLLISIMVVAFAVNLFSRSSLIRPFNPKEWEDNYNKSQWVVPQSQNPISDEGLYIHVGQQLLEGHDPALLNAEVPPLGKIILGVFNQFTGYLGVYGIFFSVLALILLFILNKILFKATQLALIPTTLFSLDPIFLDQIAVGLLDSLYLCLLLGIFILLLKRHYFLSAVIAGLFMATKSPFLVVIIYITLFVYMSLSKELTIRRFFLMPFLTLTFYTLAHFQLFLVGHDLRYFVSLQSYILHFYQTGAQGIFGAVIPLILSGYWFTWFDQDRFIKEWSFIWPIISLLSLFASLQFFKRSNFTNPFILLVLWSIFYLGFLCLTPVFPRYLLLLLPFLYNLSIWFLFRGSLQK